MPQNLSKVCQRFRNINKIKMQDFHRNSRKLVENRQFKQIIRNAWKPGVQSSGILQLKITFNRPISFRLKKNQQQKHC